MISFASFIFLAHAVVPHHHHDQMACFVLPFDNANEHEHDCCGQHEADHQENHDTDNTNDCCLLNDIPAVVPNSYKPEELNTDFSFIDKISNHYISMIITPDNGSNQIKGLTASRYLPEPVNFYEEEVFPCLGLRAPPIS